MPCLCTQKKAESLLKPKLTLRTMLVPSEQNHLQGLGTGPHTLAARTGPAACTSGLPLRPRAWPGTPRRSGDTVYPGVSANGETQRIARSTHHEERGAVTTVVHGRKPFGLQGARIQKDAETGGSHLGELINALPELRGNTHECRRRLVELVQRRVLCSCRHLGRAADNPR